MVIPATQMRVGMLIKHNGELYRIANVVHITPGNWRGMVQIKMRSLRSGNTNEQRFRSEDKVERVTMEQHDMEFLYEADGAFHFMNSENYEQITLDREWLGDAVNYLIPNSKVQVEFYEEKPMGVMLPKTVDLRVVDTEPGIKGATVTNVLKAATVETGAIIQVPPFVTTDDVIRVDTETGEYLSRAR